VTGLSPNTNYSVEARASEAGGITFDSTQSPFGNAVYMTTSKMSSWYSK